MTVVDTCVLSSLAKIDRLDLLRKSFENIIVAPSVVNEISLLKIRDSYNFSEDDKEDLFSYFE